MLKARTLGQPLECEPGNIDLQRPRRRIDLAHDTRRVCPPGHGHAPNPALSRGPDIIAPPGLG